MELNSLTLPHHVFPEELWDFIAKQMKPSTFQVFRHAIPGIHNAFQVSTRVEKLFPVVLQVLYANNYVGPEVVKSCREACFTWKEVVDEYFQNTNFHSLETKRGAQNFSDLVLNMPLEREDIARIYEMDLFPRCVSFGHKLTLQMRYDEGNIEVFPDHLHELNLLLRTVTNFWLRFEHLEVRELDAIIETGGDHIQRRENRRYNRDYILVPFGDIGADEKLQEWHMQYYHFPCSNDFQMHIPFIHLMTNLKKLTLRTRGNLISTRILLHIPRTDKLKEIYMQPPWRWYNAFWSQSCAVLLQKCANNVTYLAGITSACIKTCGDWINANNGAGPVLGNLKELHIVVDYGWIQNRVNSLSAFTIKSMFPMVTILGVTVEARFKRDDLWTCLGNFANKFPRLKYLSLSGECIPPWCNYSKPFPKAEHSGVALLNTDQSVLSKFKFQCPIHVPFGLMYQFPSLKHVVIEEWPDKCQRSESKSNDWDYVNDFFNTFSNLSSLSFVPINPSEEPGNVLRGPGTVTHFRGDLRQ